MLKKVDVLTRSIPARRDAPLRDKSPASDDLFQHLAGAALYCQAGLGTTNVPALY